MSDKSAHVELRTKLLPTWVAIYVTEYIIHQMNTCYYSPDIKEETEQLIIIDS